MKKKEMIQEIEKEYQLCGKKLWCVHKKIRTKKEKQKIQSEGIYKKN